MSNNEVYSLLYEFRQTKKGLKFVCIFAFKLRILQ